MTEPKSQCKCIDCNLPELESLGYKPTKPSRATKENLTPIIEPKIKVENSEVAGQPLEQPIKDEPVNCESCGDTKKVYGDPYGEKCPVCPEQPNTELLIVKTIQGLTTCISNELEKLVALRGCMPINNFMVVIDQAVEDIDSFEKTTLFELQKAFE